MLTESASVTYQILRKSSRVCKSSQTLFSKVEKVKWSFLIRTLDRVGKAQLFTNFDVSILHLLLNLFLEHFLPILKPKFRQRATGSIFIWLLHTLRRDFEAVIKISFLCLAKNTDEIPNDAHKTLSVSLTRKKCVYKSYFQMNLYFDGVLRCVCILIVVAFQMLTKIYLRGLRNC